MCFGYIRKLLWFVREVNGKVVRSDNIGIKRCFWYTVYREGLINVVYIDREKFLGSLYLSRYLSLLDKVLKSF